MSLVLLGILNSQAAAAGGAEAWDWLETTTLTSSSADIEFTNLNTTYASDYDHLLVRAETGNTGTSNYQQDLLFRINGDSGTNYDHNRFMNQNGTIANTDVAGQTYALIRDCVPVDGDPKKGSADIYLMDCFSTTKKSHWLAIHGGATSSESATGLTAGNFRSTSALDSLLFYSSSNNLTTGSTISIYGFKGA